jgi:hypothetical protein
MNDQLIEEAQEYINSGELSSTPYQDALEADLKYSDLDSLWHHIILVRDFLREDEALDRD